MAFFGILPLPVLIDGARHLCQPRTILGRFKNFSRRKKFCAVLRRVAQRLEQPSDDERRNVVRLAVEHPSRLLRR